MADFSEDARNFPYEDGSEIITSYVHDSGVLAVPVAKMPVESYLVRGPDEYPVFGTFAPQSAGAVAPDRTLDVEFVRVHAGITMKVVRFTLIRKGRLPVCPATDPDCSIQVLLYKVFTPMSRLRDANGNPIYRVSGYYVYAVAVANPYTEQNGYPGPEVPGVIDVADTNVYRGGNVFSNTLIE